MLQCSKCSKKACLSCLNKFVLVMQDNCVHNKVTVSNKWVNDVITFVKSGGSYHPENFVGSCCNLNLPVNKGNFLPSNIAKTYLGTAPKLIDEACVVSSKPTDCDDCDLIMILSTTFCILYKQNFQINHPYRS